MTPDESDLEPRYDLQALLDEYHKYQRECHARREACMNISDWLKDLEDAANA